MKKLLLLPMILLLGSFFLFGRPPVQNVGATNLPKITLCHHTQAESNTWVTIEVSIASVLTHLGHGDTLGACVTASPTPTPSASPTPSESPIPTPSGSPTPTETPNPCDQEVTLLILKDDEEVPCITPTPSATPSATPTPEEPKGFVENGPAGAPTCDGVPFVKLPANAHVIRNGDSAEVKWSPTQGSEAHIYYYEVQHPENKHSVHDTQNDGYEVIHGLGSKDWTFGVQQKDGCATSATVFIVDGNSPKLFRFEYVW